MYSKKNSTDLNDRQKLAVTLETDKNSLILAGAGSGKTRVLTYRIAHLIINNNLNAANILAVTFTNKAANEMKVRLETLLKRPVMNMWIGTFHSIAHRLLRIHHNEAKLTANFQILDAQDQLRLVKKIIKELSIDESKFQPKKVQWFINNQKDEGKRAKDIDPEYNYFLKQAVKIYEKYESYCNREGLVDFAELLLKAHELLRDNKDLLELYQNKFKHILVDEFQDTNQIQYAFIRLLYGKNNSVFCVGDDDQSIYGWRGAKIENILKYETDFAPVIMIRLEQNYRSSANILKASNALISNNKDRLGKSLWTADKDGDLIDVYDATSDLDEANYVAQTIEEYLTSGGSLVDLAVLYRTNAQSRVIEDALIKRQIAYTIYGGMRFFDRAEIKNALCYLRMVVNPNDNQAFERIVNFPTRGIGNQSINKITTFANKNNTSYWLASKNIAPNLAPRAKNAILSFINLIEEITNDVINLELAQKIEHIIKASSLLSFYNNDKTDVIKSKVKNLEELIIAANQYKHEDDGIDKTLGFLTLTTLDSDIKSSEKDDSKRVKLMTIHAAKGLEFQEVFLIGMEEDLFPSIQSKDDPNQISEERRLCYVAMTRAMRRLHLSYAEKRFHRGQTYFSYPSRFIQEIPEEYLNYLDNFNAKNYTTKIENSNAEFKVGSLVRHNKFGLGTILNCEGSGETSRVQVNFKNYGTKWLITSYANLEVQ